MIVKQNLYQPSYHDRLLPFSLVRTSDSHIPKQRARQLFNTIFVSVFLGTSLSMIVFLTRDFSLKHDLKKFEGISENLALGTPIKRLTTFGSSRKVYMEDSPISFQRLDHASFLASPLAIACLLLPNNLYNVQIKWHWIS